METTKLTSTITVENYRQLKRQKDKEAIATMLSERFRERYIEPFKDNKCKHGFSMMASACLMIEALYCFHRGRKRTGECGAVAFENFFKDSEKLQCFEGYGESFYKNVRCGILHQGETYGGWKIRRKGELFNPQSLVINATRFVDSMESELERFIDQLRNTRFHRKPWTGVIRKLDHICENCTS